MSSLRGISKQGILASFIITVLIIVIVVMYFDDYFNSANIIVSKKIENKFFKLEISVINPNRSNGVAPNDELIFIGTYDIKSENVEFLNPIIEIKYRDEPIKSIEIPQYFILQDGSRYYQIPILIEDLGYTTITLSTEFDYPNTYATYEHERKGVIVKTISELQQEKLEKVNNNAFIVTAIIGSITATAITGTYLITKKNSIFLKEQNKISEKHTEYFGMLEIMRYFNDPRIANERDRIIRAYRSNSLYDEVGGFQGKDLGEIVASVRGTFDQMGKLVLDKYVNEEQFYNMYADSVIVMYKILKKHIDTEREKRESNFLAHNFESIFNQAREYWKTKFPNEKEPEPF